MDNFTTELMAAIVKKQDVKEVFRQRLEDAVNLLLERELTVFLDYEKWDVDAKDTENKRNGYYQRDFKTEYGVLHLRICRDRLGEFQQQTLPHRKRSSDDLETTIIKLYSRGITTRKVSEIVEQMYGHYYSAATVSQ